MVKRIKEQFPAINVYDLLRTFCAFTSNSIAMNFKNFLNFHPAKTRLIVSGGGAHHTCVMKFLKDLFNPIQVLPSSKLDISIDSKEALGFAIFAVAYIKEIPGNIPSVTGANKPVILGKMTS